MGLEELLKQFDWSKLSFFVLFALPGFVSLQIWALIVPSNDKLLRDSLPEALGFGVLNAMIGGPLVVVLAPSEPWAFYGLLVITLVALPAAWPFIGKWCLGKLAEHNLILNRNRNGWDAVFQRRDPLFVIVHLKDGRRIGGFLARHHMRVFTPPPVTYILSSCGVSVREDNSRSRYPDRAA